MQIDWPVTIDGASQILLSLRAEQFATGGPVRVDSARWLRIVRAAQLLSADGSCRFELFSTPDCPEPHFLCFGHPVIVTRT